MGGMGSEQEEWGSDTHKSRDTKEGVSVPCAVSGSATL